MARLFLELKSKKKKRSLSKTRNMLEKDGYVLFTLYPVDGVYIYMRKFNYSSCVSVFPDGSKLDGLAIP